jgi:GNAT superfamily N-acetyltransferase
LADPAGGRAHLNLVDSSRQLFEFDSGAELEATAGWLFGAGTPDNPVISNAAFRTDDGVEGAEVVARAQDFFIARGRGFSLWVRGEESEDADLVAAASAAGLRQVYAMPEMVLERRPEALPLAPGVELRRLDSGDDAPTYWRIAASSYADIGFPPEVFEHYDGRQGLLADNVAAFIAELDGEPVGISMAIVSRGVAGIYWVGNLKQARGRGIGRAVTAAATNAGFDLGANLASLQASPMGKPIYEAMGFRTLFDYRLLMSPPPG